MPGFAEMPVDQRVEGGVIDRDRVDPAGPQRDFLLAAIDTHEAILLPDEMKDGKIGEDAPEQESVLPVEQCATDETQQRNEEKRDAVFLERSLVEVGPVEGAVDMRHVDEEDQDDPTRVGD